MSDDGHGHSHDDHDDHDGGHDHHHGTDETIDFAVLTISSSRSLDEDESGSVAVDAVEAAGHTVEERAVIIDDEGAIRERVETLAGDVDVIVTTGGTGLTDDDVTIEAIRPLLDPEIPGVGEYFRRLSHEQVGTACLHRPTDVCEHRAVQLGCLRFVQGRSLGEIGQHESLDRRRCQDCDRCHTSGRGGGVLALYILFRPRLDWPEQYRRI